MPRRRWPRPSGTQAVGIAAYAVLSLRTEGDIAPDWVLGLFLGAGGLIGRGGSGPSMQGPGAEQNPRRVLGVLALVLGVRYLVVGLG